MTPSASTHPYKHHRFPGEMLSYAVWLYVRLCLSQRDVETGSVTDSCAMTPWRKGVHSSRAIASKALAGAHRTNYIDIQQVVKQSQPASMMTLDKLSPSFTGRIRISTVICYASVTDCPVSLPPGSPVLLGCKPISRILAAHCRS